MATQMQEPPSNTQQRPKRFRWLSWIVVAIILVAILSFPIGAFVILKNQGITQGTTILTIISIVVGVVIGLLGLLVAFLQWFSPRHTGEHRHPTASPHPSQPALPIGQIPGSTQVVQSNITKGSPLTNSVIISQSEGGKATEALGLTSRDHREDWGDAPYIANFYGREKELADLEQ